MPTVGNKKFSYTTAGQDAARKYAKDTKQSIVYSYNEGGLYQSPYTFTNTGAPLAKRSPQYLNKAATEEGKFSMGPPVYSADFVESLNKMPNTEDNMEKPKFDREDYMNKLKQMEEGGEVEGPKYPHDMYNISTGEKFIAQNKEDHDEMSEKGYKHLDELDANEKKMVEDKVNQMAMGGKYEQFKRMMGLD